MPKNNAIKIGDYVHDWTLGRFGIVVDGPWVQCEDDTYHATGDGTPWEWLILYEGGELLGADTCDINPSERDCDWDTTAYGEQR